MRLLFLCSFVLLATLPGLAQKLQYRTLLKYRMVGEPMELHEKLSKKGWTLLSDTPPTDSLTGTATWAYKPVDDKATAWVTLYYFYNQYSVIRYHGDCNCTLYPFYRIMRKWGMKKGEQGQHTRGFQEPYQFTEYIGRKNVIRLLQFPSTPFAVEIFDTNYYYSIKQELY